MALIKCEECGHMISDKAVKCPKCGCPVARKPVVPAQPTTVQHPQVEQRQPEPHQLPEKQENKKNVIIILLSVALVAVVVGIGLYFLLGGNATTNNTGDEGLESEMAVEPQKGPSIINGHEYVDLGLSVKWATCNVGASTPEEYGNYYAWGETSSKSEYTSKNCATYNKSMEDIAGNSNYDAARANWGGTWRLPTLREIDELIDNCTTEWTSRNGVKGYLVTSKKNGNSIFLPAAGDHDGSSFYHAEEYGTYWISSPRETGIQDAYSLFFNNEKFYWDWSRRRYGRSVRPVSD